MSLTPCLEEPITPTPPATTSTMTTTTTPFEMYENPNLDFPIKVGNILYQLKKNSIRKVAEWATVHNSRINFPMVTFNNTRYIKRKIIKLYSAQSRREYWAENAHEQGQGLVRTQKCVESSAICEEANISSPQHSCEKCKEKDSKIQSLIQDLETMRKELKSARRENESLKKEVEENRKKQTVSKNTIRKLYYSCILKNVSERNIVSLVKLILNFLDIRSVAYSRATTQRMVGEIGFISDIQTVQAVLDSESATIAFDATTQDGIHVNCLMLCTAVESFVINVQHLPGGTATDYSSHIFSSIENLAVTYSTAYKLPYEEVFSKIVSKITCVLSDRASVNHATIFILEKKLGKSLVELNCNIHPLEAITKNFLKGIHEAESEAGKTIFSNQSCLVYNLISSINSLRYSNTKGSIKEFKIALKKSGIEFTIPRFRGNRINVVFHLSFIYFSYKDSLLQALKCVDKELASKTISSLNNEELNIEIQVFAILDKIFSGPWMTMFYSSLKNQKPIIDGIETVKRLVETVQAHKDHPLKILEMTKDFFGNPLAEDVKVKLFQFPSNQAIFSSFMGIGLNCICNILQRQYFKQFTSMDDLRKTSLSSARQHTMEIESVIGQFSAMKKSASNSNIIRISNIIKGKRNNIIELLQKPGINDLIPLAKTQSNIESHKNIKRKEAVFAEESRRLADKRQAQEDKKKKHLD